MVNVNAKGELEGEFGFLQENTPVKVRDLFGVSDVAITNGLWVHHGSHNIRSKKGHILLDLHSKKFGSSHVGYGISWDTPAKTKLKQNTRLLSEKYEILSKNGTNEYYKTFNKYLLMAKRDCRLLALVKNEMSDRNCSKAKIIEPQGRSVLKSLKEDFNFYSFSHHAGSIPLPEKFDYSNEPKVNYAKKLLDLTFGKNYRRLRERFKKHGK